MPPVAPAAVTVKECWQVAVFYQPTEPVREGGGRMEHFSASPPSQFDHRKLPRGHNAFSQASDNSSGTKAVFLALSLKGREVGAHWATV
ncbi:hypothetical protein CDAR_468861 [Caerostris darwini]|uniref:Uncharacterized protein n=1 Tax=Caerostris darwini TaxID=1538125 RepID=A0AAV4R3B4_9ARAC|nr:hypothetical protein CDAR_468861 [Caerostris darwini]